MAEAGAQLRWLVCDHLGTPRMVIDQTGSLSGVKRHDYLPFGEELMAGAGGRMQAQGYTADNVRQQFTSKERDVETQLDYFGARYFSSIQGRFTGVDAAGPDLINPQTLNKYQYTLNNPLRYVDPDGLYEEDVHHDLTYVLALAVGFSQGTASSIASADQWVDDNPKTSPFASVQARRLYHFTTDVRLGQLQLNAMYGNTDDVGIFLHALQDSYSHEGYGPKKGQIDFTKLPWHWTDADKTYKDEGKANRMAKDTYDSLLYVLTVWCEAGKTNVKNEAVPWEMIEPYVHEFNMSDNNGDKKYYLKEMRRVIKEFRKRKRPDDPSKIRVATSPYHPDGCIPIRRSWF